LIFFTAYFSQEKNVNIGIFTFFLANHQTGHNSGVIHAGIYYEPGSLKAQLCWKGLKKLYKYCEENNIPCKRVGKVLFVINNNSFILFQI